jgi:hypothetical protein
LIPETTGSFAPNRWSIDKTLTGWFVGSVEAAGFSYAEHFFLML